MTVFSELLSQYITNKDIKTNALAQYCGYDRSNMYKIINGKRNPPSAEFVEKAANFMHLSPAEKQELEEAYEISINGYDNYYRRKEVLEFFDEFTLSSNVFPAADYNLSSAGETKDLILLNGTYEISSALLHLVTLEAQKSEGHIRLLIQPEFHYIFSILAAHGCGPHLRIDHIICLNNNTETMHLQKNYNLNCLKYVLPLYNYSRHYNINYYYDNILSKNGTFTLFPYMVVTSQYTCFLTADMQKGFLIKDTQAIKMFSGIFDTYLYNSSPLLKRINNISNQLEHINVTNIFQSPGYCFQMSPCLTFFLTPCILEKYIKKDLPDRSHFIRQFTEYIKNNLRHHVMSSINFVFSLEGILYFLETGLINEYPSDVYDPLDIPDRIYLVRQLLQACKIHNIRILKKTIGNIGTELFLYVNKKHGYLMFSPPPHEAMVCLDIEEPGLLYTFYDFCENLNPDLFYSQEEANQLILSAVEKISKKQKPVS